MERAKELLESGTWTVIIGLFDPLTALQARRVEACGGDQTLIVVLEGPDALLPADDRCRLMAALRSVSFVAKATRHERQAIAAHRRENLHVIDDENEEKRRSQDFFELVASRRNN